jgi:hypothetical protein
MLGGAVGSGKVGLDGAPFSLTHEAAIPVPAEAEIAPEHGTFERVRRRTLKGTEEAKRAWDEQIALGDHPVFASSEKVAQLNAHADIAGTFAGTGCGDIVHRFHEGLHTSGTVIRSVDVDHEAFAALEYGAAPTPVCLDRTRAIVEREWQKLEDLGNAQVEHGYRSGPGQPLVKDRRLFVLGRTASASGVWLGLKYRPELGADPRTIYVHARFGASDVRLQKEAIEALGVNLLNAAFFRRTTPMASFLSSLTEGLPEGLLEVDFAGAPGAAPFAPSGVPPPEPFVSIEHPPIGRNRRALEKVRRLVDADVGLGSVTEIGAGQLVADLLERIAGSGSTVVSKGSSYGMEMSAHRYGAARAVSFERLSAMLDRDYGELESRVTTLGLQGKKLFAFANTVATKAGGHGAGWLGIEFQAERGGPRNRIMLHVRMLQDSVPDQEAALAALGVNLMTAALKSLDREPRAFSRALFDGVDHGAIAVDFVDCSGTDLTDWQPREIQIELLRSKKCDALVFMANGKTAPASEHFYKRTTLFALDRDLGATAQQNVTVRLDLSAFERNDRVDTGALLRRIGELNARGFDVLLTRRPVLHDLVSLLSNSGIERGEIAVSRGELRRLFDPRTYAKRAGGMAGLLESLGLEQPPKLVLRISPDPITLPSREGQRLYDLLESRGVIVEDRSGP